MADQIKNENVGEVSSPTTEEKMTAPKRKEPIFADPQEKNAPSNEGVVGDFPSEGTPERKLPVFKNDRGAEDGEIPPRREPIIKEKERKLPVFANEVKQHKDEDEFEEFLESFEIYTLNRYNDREFECFKSEYTTPNGESVVSFGYYGSDY